MRQMIDRAARHLPARPRRWVDWAFSRWPGRLLTASATGFARIEIFDRAMTIAAQCFTSIFPILLMTATWLGPDSRLLGDVTGLPEQSQSVLDEALHGSASTTYGIVGSLIVLASATSFSRALTRAYAAIWQLPRPSLRIGSAWRWFAALLAMALSVAVTFTFVRQLSHQPPRGFWGTCLSFALDVGLGVFVPWVLLARQVRPRHLLAGATVIAVALLFVRPATAAWMPHALDVSAQRYGSIGVAFTYLAFLYTVSFCWLGGALIGQVITTDEGWFGRWIRGDAAPGGPEAPADPHGVAAPPPAPSTRSSAQARESAP